MTPREKAEKLIGELRIADPTTFKQLSPRLVLEIATTGLFEVRDALRERLAQAEARIAALEGERKGFYYRGTWGEGESYDEGDFVTDHGSMWACLAPTTTRPGTSDAWQLAVKSGRDRRR